MCCRPTHSFACVLHFLNTFSICFEHALHFEHGRLLRRPAGVAPTSNSLFRRSIKGCVDRRFLACEQERGGGAMRRSSGWGCKRCHTFSPSRAVVDASFLRLFTLWGPLDHKGLDGCTSASPPSLSYSEEDMEGGEGGGGARSLQ